MSQNETEGSGIAKTIFGHEIPSRHVILGSAEEALISRIKEYVTLNINAQEREIKISDLKTEKEKSEAAELFDQA